MNSLNVNIIKCKVNSKKMSSLKYENDDNADLAGLSLKI